MLSQKTNFGQKKNCSDEILVKKKFGLKITSCPKNFWSEKIFVSKTQASSISGV